jgi:hypothetical protein
VHLFITVFLSRCFTLFSIGVFFTINHRHYSSP